MNLIWCLGSGIVVLRWFSVAFRLSQFLPLSHSLQSPISDESSTCTVREVVGETIRIIQILSFPNIPENQFYLFKFNTTNLTGPEFSSSVRTERDGGVILEVPSRDWFIQPTEDLRVVVTVNHTRSNCSSNNCTYEYSMNSTATISSVSPLNGES